MPDDGEEDAIFHVEVVVVLRFAGYEHVRTRSYGVAPKEGSAATAEGDATHRPTTQRRVAHAGHVEHGLQVVQEIHLVHRLCQLAHGARSGL